MTNVFQQHSKKYITEKVRFGNLKKSLSWALVALTYNPSYSGGRDQEDHSSKPA
jgi:hypothetical protein